MHQASINPAQGFINDFFAPPRSQSFSGVEKKQLDKSRLSSEEFQKRSTLSLDQSSLVPRNQESWKQTSTMNRVRATRQESENNSNCSSSVIQRTKTFSKYLSTSKRKVQVRKSILQSEKYTNKGTVSAQNEFLVGFNPEARTEEGSFSSEIQLQNSVFLAKGRLTHLLKTTQLEQLSKLQSKHQKECDLLDDIRNFSKQRAQIERDYGQALQKLALQYQKKEGMDVECEDENEKMITSRVWKAALDATEELAQARITQAESYRNNIYEEAKSCRIQKDIQLKKCQELLVTVQNELTDTVKELSRTKKKYYELDQAANLAREKLEEADAKLKKNQTSIFKSKSGMEKALLKLRQKCDDCNCNAAKAKNEYLLTISAANAHQKRYYEVDLPETIQILDGNIFTKLQEYIAMLSQYELNSCAVTQTSFSRSLNSSTKISRDFEAWCFLRENPIFEWAALYEFESSNHDKSDAKLKEEQSGSDNSLNREARKWTFRVERDKQQLEKLRSLQEELKSTYTNHEPETSDSAACEADAQLEKCRQELRKVETSLLLGESRLALLRDANVELDIWTESARTQLAKDQPLISTPGGISHRKTLISSGQNGSLLESDNIFSIGSPDGEFDESDSDEFDENFINLSPENPQDDASIQSNENTRAYPITCTVVYPYQANREDELSIAVGDKIEVIEDGDLDQWVKARDSSGKLGFVPENYLEFPSYNLASKLQSLIKEINHSKASSSSSRSSSASSHSYSSENDREVSCIITKSKNLQVSSSIGFCLAKAVYSYEACKDDELSFPVGAVINILSKNESGVDDGWWKGELNGKTGLFPALIVEEFENNETKCVSKQSSTSDESSVFLQPPLEPLKATSSPNEFDSKAIVTQSVYEIAFFQPAPKSPNPARPDRMPSGPGKPTSQAPTVKRPAPAPPIRRSLLD